MERQRERARENIHIDIDWIGARNRKLIEW